MSWAPITSSDDIPEIDISWVKKNMNANKFQLVDCRELNEWNVGHIDTAIFCPLSSWKKDSIAIPKDKPIVVYCRSGKRSLTAAGDLLSKGYQAASMIGGIIGFNR